MQTTNQSYESNQKDVAGEKLKECYQNELSAMETYELALKSIDHVGLHRSLQELLTSHARRVELLRDQMSRLGVDVPKSSGAWGAFSKLVQTGADLLGDRAAIATLEEGEDRGLASYAKDLTGCDAKTRQLIEEQLLPEQKRTHELCRSLKEYVKAPN